MTCLHKGYSFSEIPGVRSSPSIRCGWVCRMAYISEFEMMYYLSDVAGARNGTTEKTDGRSHYEITASCFSPRFTSLQICIARIATIGSPMSVSLSGKRRENDTCLRGMHCGILESFIGGGIAIILVFPNGPLSQKRGGEAVRCRFDSSDERSDPMQ